MNNIQRAALLTLAALVAAGAFLVLRPNDDGAASRAEQATQNEADTGAQATGAADDQAEDGAEVEDRSERRARRSRDQGPLLTSAGVRDITVRRGDLVRFRVRSSTPEEVHVHGYDIYDDVEPGETTRFRFRADLEGIYEVELHGSGAQIAELRVEP